ncbi:MAG: hypothetical protein FJ109_21225, partial [Deltaproteobacteria bacterium]|nr:hypothetical protein [Deltaproteobacteria bacterium]
MARFIAAAAFVAFLIAWGGPSVGQSQAPSPSVLAEKIVDDMENLMRGKASVGEMEMYIKRWDRTLT